MPARRTTPSFVREPYTWLSALVVLAFVPVLVRLPALGDLFVHAGTIEQLRLHLLAPRDPMTGTDGLGNPYFSPWAVGWALVARGTGWDVFAVLRLSGVVNLLLLLVGFRAFVRSVSSNPWAPVTSLLAACFLWGTNLLYWSGFISLPTLVAGIAYPSTFAVGLMLLLLAGLTRVVLDPPSRHLFPLVLGIAVGAAVAVLVHQFTALAFGIYAVALVLRHHRRIARRVWLALGVGAALGLAVLAAWPLFSVFSAAGGLDGFDAVHKVLYTNLAGRYLLLLVAVPVLVHRLRGDRADPLAWTVGVCLAVFVMGGLTGHEALARVFPPVALLSQVAVGVAVADWLRPRRSVAETQTRPQRVFAAVASLAIVAGCLFQSGVVNLLSPGSYPATLDRLFHSRLSKGDYEWLAEHVPAGSTVMTADWDTRAMAPAYGIFTVQPAWPDPFLGRAEDRRIADTKTFFRSATSSARRAELLAKYHTEWVVVRGGAAEPFIRSGSYALVAERPAGGPRDEGAGGTAQLLRLVHP
ncbi:hypothetical protein [Terrabacter sp. NPDC080008]|uniref:hypothetical protein n=1 Tax=Terrabacter sp. NPDC080008 TaxID=3155176 RepID=UPI00344E66EA